MTIAFPYEQIDSLVIPNRYHVDLLHLPESPPALSGPELVRNALESPVGSKALRELASNASRVLIVTDDITRPTPVYQFISLILRELVEAGVPESGIEFIMSLGTHRPMRPDEIDTKLGHEAASRHVVHNHDWRDREQLEYLGETLGQVPIYVNRIVQTFDLVVGVGSIMPIDICGFTGGGKILIPGLSGEDTVDHMHWARVNIPSEQVIGQVDNPVRRSIDEMARRAGLGFIVNVVLDSDQQIVAAFAGDMVAAHRAGCERARQVYGVPVQEKYDIVVADSFPFDVEFWQANKALDTAGEFVADDGVIILVTPCYEGLSQTHSDEIRRFGYRSIKEIKRLVENGKMKHRVVGVHMYQVSRAVVEKAHLILVSTGINEEEAKSVGLSWAGNPQEAFRMAVDLRGPDPRIAVMKDAARILPILPIHNPMN